MQYEDGSILSEDGVNAPCSLDPPERSVLASEPRPTADRVFWSDKMSEFTSSDEPGVAVVEPESQTTVRQRRQPNYALIIENDDDHTFDYVVMVVSRVCGHSIEKALELTIHAHNHGEAMVWSGTLELAELKQEQIRSFGPDPFANKPVAYPLGVRIEPLVGD